MAFCTCFLTCKLLCTVRVCAHLGPIALFVCQVTIRDRFAQRLANFRQRVREFLTI